MATDRTTLLVLWDIDHTLIDTRGVGRQLYRQAFETVTGHEMIYQVDPTGRTELAIFADTIERHGIPAGEDLQTRYAAELARQYAQHADLLRSLGRALPGAAQALTALAQEPGVIQTVLTGNLRAVAATKLQVFELDQHIDFGVGAYGEDDNRRAKLVAVAEKRASDKHAVTFDRTNTVVVGDTTSDVTAAHEGGATIVAVASGRDGVSDLREAGAEITLEDLTNTADVLEAVTALRQRP